ncbi:MAG: hypothetical protein KGQ59_08395 [Bdellovibrionales bacterium]|nr:hypothetical protein [Bdellovibrionales bacterium]
MSFFDPRMLDPSKLKPETLMKMSQLIQELPQSLVSRMQAIMHNSMAGFDVRKEVESFEQELPAGFKERMAKLLYEAHGVVTNESPSKSIDSPKEARMTILQAIASGELSPEKAYEVLFAD